MYQGNLTDNIMWKLTNWDILAVFAKYLENCSGTYEKLGKHFFKTAKVEKALNRMCFRESLKVLNQLCMA